jgi:hypothetical protein
MPTNRKPTRRGRRPPRYTAETLALFAELEAAPPRRLSRQDFKDKECQLARLLGLPPPWLSGSSVLDRERAPCRPEGMCAREDWFRCRDMRQKLLEAAAQSAGKTGAGSRALD